MEYIVQTRGLSKEYDGNVVVEDINMHIKKGEIYGFLGKNGAGKSTIMKIIMNLVRPNSGEVVLFGKKVRQDDYEYLKRVGSIIEEPIFYDHLTAKENLELHCSYMGYPNTKEIPKILDLLKLSNIEKKKVSSFSVGMRQRLGIARALLTRPELLVLDEPINGLDPSGIKEMRNLFRDLSAEYETTILISSHILSEIEHIASTVGVLANHHLVQEVSMQQIRNMAGDYIEVSLEDIRKGATVLDKECNIRNYKIVGDNTLRIYDTGVSKNEIMKALLNKNIYIDGIMKKSISLEEYFIDLTEGAM